MSGMTIKPAGDWSKQVEMLRKLPDVLANKVILKALELANQPAAAEAKKAAKDPSKHGRKSTGRLAASIVVTTGRERNELWASVSPRKGAGASRHLVESGHRIAVKGTLQRSDGKQAGVYKPTRIQKLQMYISNKGRYKKRIKALQRYLAEVGDKGALTAEVLASAKLHENTQKLLAETQGKTFLRGKSKLSAFLEGAMKTGGLYSKTVGGVRGQGRMVGSVPAYPFLEPTFVAQSGTIARLFEGLVEVFARDELAKLSA